MNWGIYIGVSVSYTRPEEWNGLRGSYSNRYVIENTISDIAFPLLF